MEAVRDVTAATRKLAQLQAVLDLLVEKQARAPPPPRPHPPPPPPDGAADEAAELDEFAGGASWPAFDGSYGGESAARRGPSLLLESAARRGPQGGAAAVRRHVQRREALHG